MAVSGDLKDINLGDLLYLLSLRGATGRVRLINEDEGDEATLYLRHGVIINVTSARVPQRLGELLMESGLLTRRQVVRMLQRQVRAQSPLGSLLLRHKLLTRAQLNEALVRQANEILCRVLAWEGGFFQFEAVPPDRLGVPLAGLNVQQVVLEAVRRLDERGRMQQLAS
jgi:hypothetical protein